jgi:hypothetical protein
VDVLQVLIELPDDTRLPIGLEVDVKIRIAERTGP